MADQLRTQADLLAKFADGQEAGSITPQDVRDLIISLTPALGTIYFSTPIETVITTPGTFVKALGTTTIVATPHGVGMPTNNRISYTQSVERHFSVDCSIAAQTAGANKTILYQLYKNGVAMPETLMTRAHSGAGSNGVVALTTSVHLALNDYIELWVANQSDSTNLTITNGTLNIKGHIVE